MPQRQRLHRMGVRDFFRLPSSVSTLGDCGSFSYIDEPAPPYSATEVLDFYETCGFEAGVSPDHVILGYQRPGLVNPDPPDEWRERRITSLRCADEFLAVVSDRGSDVEPVGAAQGWDPKSYSDSVRELQAMGYTRIALGGMVPLRTPDIIDCLTEISSIRTPSTELHLLGITRVASIEAFAGLGVTSFDSTSAFRQAFMDDRGNYHTAEDVFTAIRIPQVDGNLALKRAILSGRVVQQDAVRLERQALRALREFDNDGCSMEVALDAVLQYETVIGVKKTYEAEYRRTMNARPWRQCSCGLCELHGIDIAIFRGTERNKRRGFHNLSVLAAKISELPLRRTGTERRHEEAI